MNDEILAFQKKLTLINRGVLVALIAAFLAAFLVPVPEGMNEQMLGWLQGILGSLVVFQISSGERQNDHWFQSIDKAGPEK